MEQPRRCSLHRSWHPGSFGHQGCPARGDAELSGDVLSSLLCLAPASNQQNHVSCRAAPSAGVEPVAGTALGSLGHPAVSVPAGGTGDMGVMFWSQYGWCRAIKTEQQILVQNEVPLSCQLSALLLCILSSSSSPRSISSQRPRFSKHREKSLPLSYLLMRLPEHPPLSCPNNPHAITSHSTWPPLVPFSQPPAWHLCTLGHPLPCTTELCIIPNLHHRAVHHPHPAPQSCASPPPCTPRGAAVHPLPASRYQCPIPPAADKL